MFDGAIHPIDRFIRARLAERKIASSPQADRRTLIHRVYCDLNGLPPSFEKIEAFMKAPDPLACEQQQGTPTLNHLYYDWASLPKHPRSIYRFVWRGVATTAPGTTERVMAENKNDYVYSSLDSDSPEMLTIGDTKGSAARTCRFMRCLVGPSLLDS